MHLVRPEALSLEVLSIDRRRPADVRRAGVGKGCCAGHGEPHCSLARARLDLDEALSAGSTYDCANGLGYGFSDIARGTRIRIAGENGRTIASTTMLGCRLSSAGCRFPGNTRVPDAAF
jgi:hypothetical protein